MNKIVNYSPTLVVDWVQKPAVGEATDEEPSAVAALQSKLISGPNMVPKGTRVVHETTVAVQTSRWRDMDSVSLSRQPVVDARTRPQSVGKRSQNFRRQNQTLS